jgi:Ca2+-binding RTX toxin-like protein
MLRRLIVASVAALCLLAAAGPAAALADNTAGVGRTTANPYTGDGALVYFGAFGGANTNTGSADNVTVAKSGSSLVFTDWHHKIQAGLACQSLGEHQVRCTTANLKQLRMYGFDGSDIIDVDDNVNYPTRIEGGPNADTIYGGGSGDQLYGEAGNDHINGGPGVDSVYGGDGLDTLTGGPGNDYLYGQSGDDSLEGGPGKDLIQGGTEFDTVRYSHAGGGVRVDLQQAGGDGQPGEGDNVLTVENVVGSPFGDLIRGTAAANEIKGGNGNDRLYGRGGNDYMTGGNGDDRLYGSAGNDYLYGNAGADTLNGGLDVDFCNGGAGSDSLISCG